MGAKYEGPGGRPEPGKLQPQAWSEPDSTQEIDGIGATILLRPGFLLVTELLKKPLKEDSLRFPCKLQA